MSNSWTVTTEEDSEGNLVLPFPAEMIEQCKWQEGDTLDFDMVDGEIFIKNISLIQREGAEAAKVDRQST